MSSNTGHETENAYIRIVNKIMKIGHDMEGRNGGCRFITGEQLKFSCDRMPLLTRRKMFYKGVIGELAAFFQGPTHVKDFEDRGCNYWKEWADDDGSLRIDYGNKWLDFNRVDQVKQLLDDLKNNPTSRRMIISAWDPSNLDDLSLPCCHYAYQFIVRDNTLDLIWIQRSVDTMIGLPSDMILAWAMCVLIAKEVGLEPGEVTMQLGHVHIYDNHFDQVYTYLSQPQYEAPIANMDTASSLFNFNSETFVPLNYKHSDPVKFQLNV